MTTMKAIRWLAATGRRCLPSIAQARAELERGHVVCIFAEGAIAARQPAAVQARLRTHRRRTRRDGHTVCRSSVGGSVFSFKQGPSWKWPEQIRITVSVRFGKPMPATTSALMRGKPLPNWQATR